MKNKNVLSVMAVILIILGVGLIFLVATKNNEKNENKKTDEIVYEIAFKVNPLIKFEFSYKDDEAIVNNYTLVNDKAKQIFAEINFENMELNAALSLYGDTLVEKKIQFNTIYVITNFDKTDYFKSEKYKIKVDVVDKTYLDAIENNTKEELVFNKKYYKTEENFKYDYILFKEKGKMEYSVDDFVYETDSDVYPHSYSLEDDKLILKGNEMRGYFGWIFSHDECRILYNRIECDYYWDTNYDLKEEFIRTEYYEIID